MKSKYQMEIKATQTPQNSVLVSRISMICFHCFRLHQHGIVRALKLPRFSLNSHFMYLGSTEGVQGWGGLGGRGRLLIMI